MIQDSTKRFSSSLSTLSAGRIGIIRMCAVNHLKALIIAIRYSCARKQFGPTNDEEVPVMEYQLQVCLAGTLRVVLVKSFG